MITSFKDTSFLANLLTYLHGKEKFNYALGAHTKLCVPPGMSQHTMDPILTNQSCQLEENYLL